MRKFLYVCLVVFILPLQLFAIPGSGTLEFVENKGQWPEAFRFKMSNTNGNIFLENNVFTYVVGAAGNIDQIQGFKTGKYKKVTLNYYAYKMVFENANPRPVIEQQQVQDHYYNFFLGNDPQRWKSGIHPCMEVDYLNLYTNIDLRASSDGSRLTYDFIVKPGADPETIRVRYDGIEELHIKNGNLEIPTSVVTTEEMKPYAYQVVNGRQVQVFCRYKVNGNRVSYDFPDGYDKTKELVIDPTVVFATFTGSGYDNWGYTATYDAAGNFYAGGITSNFLGGSGYPVVPATGAIQTSFGGGDQLNGNKYPADISISKFNATGSALIYSTYLGGKSNEQPHSLIVDQAGNLIIAGRTYSKNFPVTPNGYDTSYNGNGDLILTKFNASGTALLGSTYVGGSGTDITNDTAAEFGYGNLKHNYGDDARSEVIVDQSGNIYVAASTRSTDFPTTSAAIKTTLIVGDAQDGVVLKMNSSLTSLIWSTYLGGDDNDAAYVLSLDKTESNLYVAGGTQSTNFPFTTGAYISSSQGGTDGFISKFLNSGSYPCLRSTYIGRNAYDQCYGIQVDAVNNVYAMGQTLGGTFPVSTGVYSNPGSSQFIIKLDANLSANLRSTVFGSGDASHTNISPVAFLIDTCGNIYISGWGGDIYSSSGFTPPPGTGTTNGMPIGGLAGPAAQSTTDGADFYFIVLSTNMANLLYATYMGSNGGVPEHVDGGTSRFDKNGIVYQAICGGCSKGTFPTTAGAYATTNTGPNCNLVALKIAFFLGPVDASFTLQPGTHICLGTPVTIVNTSVNATSYQWDFGDGSPTSNAQTPPPHTYTAVGTYKIRLICTNPIACNLADTFSLTVTVDNNKINPSFVATVVDTCAPFLTTFKNTSQVSATPSGTVYFWEFGDGSTYTGQTPPGKNYAKAGTYTITLVMTDPTACNSPDSVSQTVTFRDDLVKAGFNVPDLVCLGDSFAPSNTSVLAETYLWNFGDNKTSTLARPFHKFDSAGTYKVTLMAYNPNTCNKVDSLSKVITVKPSPLADFSYTPIIPVTNEINRFTNLSQNAVSYNWNFGDGTGTTETNPEHFYKRSGTYDVCLVAMNKEGCADTTCKPITADILPLADIPNAFSPNGDGNNDILYVVGAAIESIDLKIYNRWGQLVFESTDVKKGWDGTYNGKRQEVDVYAYTLNVRFVDDTTMFKKGNVTLLK